MKLALPRPPLRLPLQNPGPLRHLPEKLLSLQRFPSVAHSCPLRTKALTRQPSVPRPAHPHGRLFRIVLELTLARLYSAQCRHLYRANSPSRSHQSKMRRFGALGCFLPVFKNGSPRLRSIAANHSLGSVIIGSSSTPSGTRRTRTVSPSNRNSRGSRTAWLRPLRNSLATPLLPMGHLCSIVYTRNLYQGTRVVVIFLAFARARLCAAMFFTGL